MGEVLPNAFFLRTFCNTQLKKGDFSCTLYQDQIMLRNGEKT